MIFRSRLSLLGSAAMTRLRPARRAARPVVAAARASVPLVRAEAPVPLRRNEVTGSLAARPRPRSGLNERTDTGLRPAVPLPAVDPWPEALEPRRSDGFTARWEAETGRPWSGDPAGPAPIGEPAASGRRHRKTRRHGR